MRVRLPGGEITPAQLQQLAHAAVGYGDAHLELTGRGNIQLRGVGDPAAVAQVVADIGLVPSAAHDRARNIEVSPATGRIGGLADVRPTARALDESLRADDRLAALSGKFLFGLDDGRGDIVAQHPDLGLIVQPATDGGEVVVAIVVDGEVVGTTRLDAAPAHLIGLAVGFLARSGGVWRIADLADADRRALLDEARARLDPPPDEATVTRERPSEPHVPLVGWFEQADGHVLLGAVVESARLPARLAEFIAAVEAPVIITPHREILVCDLGEGVAETVVRVLAPMGLIFDATDPWTRLSSCVGSPGCAKSHAPVRADLGERIEVGEPPSQREHWVGCARGCGTPSEPHLRVEATSDGYRSRQVG